MPRLILLAAATGLVGRASSFPLHAQTVSTVFVIAMENHNWTQPNSAGATPAQLFGNPTAPFINSLVTPGDPNARYSSFASNYQSVGIHPSEPNYIWSEAGTSFGIGSDADPFNSDGTANTVLNTPYHLTGLLQAARIPWRSYQEDIDVQTDTGAVLPRAQWTVPLASAAGNFSTPNRYNGSTQFHYVAKHDPQVFFQDTNGGFDLTPSNPLAQNYAPLQQLSLDLATKSTARYNFITPNQYNDQHSTLSGGFTDPRTQISYTGDAARIAQGDYFLSQIVPMIEASAAWKNNGAIVIWNDETENGDSPDYTGMEIVLSPLAKGNAYESGFLYTHSSDLKTWQELFDVGADSGYLNPVTGENSAFLGDAATSGVNDLSDLFLSKSIPSQTPTMLVPESSSIALAGFGLLIGFRRRAGSAVG